MDQPAWVIYERISYARTPDGTIDTLGVERQEPPCRELVARKAARSSRCSWTMTARRSRAPGPTSRRCLPGRGRGVRGIAVWDCDRLSRNPDRDNLRIIELAERFGVELATVCGEYDLSTSSGRMMFRTAGALARRESEHKAERLMLWNDQRVKDGMPHAGGTRPFGFQRHANRQAVPHHHPAPRADQPQDGGAAGASRRGHRRGVLGAGHLAGRLRAAARAVLRPPPPADRPRTPTPTAGCCAVGTRAAVGA